MAKRRQLRSVRWGRLRELDGRARVGSPTYKAQPLRLRHLQSWRAMHKLSHAGHLSVRGYGTAKRVRPSSNLPLRQKESYVLDRA